MGFRQAAVLATTCFCLGVLFICFTVDYRVLFVPLTDQAIQDGFEFYTTFFNSPPAIKALLHGVMGVGIIGLIGKIHKWDESAMFFDGSSLAAWVFAIAVYLSVGIPASRTIARPEVDVERAEQVEALRVLSAGNVIIMVLLGGILVLQAGEEYIRRFEARELAKHAEEQKSKTKQPTTTTPLPAGAESKKDQ